MLPKYIDQNISKYIPMFYEGDLGLGEANILENLNLLCCDTSRPCFNMADIFWSIYFGRKPIIPAFFKTQVPIKTHTPAFYKTHVFKTNTYSTHILLYAKCIFPLAFCKTQVVFKTTTHRFLFFLRSPLLT